MANSDYWIMDGRALRDVDKASVLEVCETIGEAYKNVHDYSPDACIVNAQTKEVVYSLLWAQEKPLEGTKKDHRSYRSSKKRGKGHRNHH